MNLTKLRLKEIIKNELRLLLNEQDAGEGGHAAWKQDTQQPEQRSKGKTPGHSRLFATKQFTGPMDDWEYKKKHGPIFGAIRFNFYWPNPQSGTTPLIMMQYWIQNVHNNKLACCVIRGAESAPSLELAYNKAMKMYTKWNKEFPALFIDAKFNNPGRERSGWPIDLIDNSNKQILPFDEALKEIMEAAKGADFPLGDEDDEKKPAPRRFAGMSTKYLQRKGYKWNGTTMVHPTGTKDIWDVMRKWCRAKKRWNRHRGCQKFMKLDHARGHRKFR